MSRPDLDRLLDDARREPLLLADLRTRLGDADELVRWAEGKGYDLDLEEITDLQDSERELSDEELDQAAGGDWTPTPPPGGTGTGGGG